MNEAMRPGAENDAHDGDEDESAEESVSGSKELRSKGWQTIDGSHAAQNHRRVQKGVDPREARKRAITPRSESNDDDDERARNRNVAAGAFQELWPWQESVFAVLVQCADP
jgi:hypothetical protein